MVPDGHTIHELHTTWVDAVNAGDLVRLLSLTTIDVVFLNPGQAPFGRDGLSCAFSTAHQQSRISCTSDLIEVVIVGEIAYTLSRDSVSVTPHADGKTHELAGHRLTLYHKQSDGRWLLARDVNTLIPRPNQAG